MQSLIVEFHIYRFYMIISWPVKIYMVKTLDLLRQIDVV